MTNEATLTLHKIVATHNLLKLVEALQENNIERQAILVGLITCFNQQIVDAKGIDKLFKNKKIGDNEDDLLNKLVEEVKHSCEAYLSELLES